MVLKKYSEFEPNECCVFCKLRETDVLYGPIYKSKTKYKQKPIVVHYYCLLLASKIDQNGRDNQGILGFFPKDIIKELGRGSSLRCCYCNSFGATVHCIFKGCGKIFHLPCGIKKGSIHQFFHLFDSYCHVHRLKQTIPANILKDVKENCVICCLEIDKRNKLDNLWPTCCKPAVLIHRRCIQSMALNAGYYFKCPLCNNAPVFKTEMLRMGIHVPDQDASWELEPNAYEELRARGSGCEVEVCVCPKGRDYEKKNTPWQVELCQVCGGNGVHLGCTDKWDRNRGFLFNWFCKICKNVYKANKDPEIKDEAAESNSTNSSDTNSDSVNPQSSSLNVLRLRSGNIRRTSSDSTQGVEPTKPSSCDSDDDIIVVSEDEEELKPVNVLPNPPAQICKEEKHPPSNDPLANDDDDVEIVGVVPNKRKNADPSISRKRFRTAHWQFDENTQKDKISGPSTLANTLITISKGNICNTPAKNQLYLQTHPGILNLPPASSSDTTTKQPNAVTGQSEGISLPSKIPLNLSEVSINRIVAKSSLNQNTTDTIDLSSDDECDQQSTIIQKRSALKALLQKTQNPLNLYESLVNKKLQQNSLGTSYNSTISKFNLSIDNDSKMKNSSLNINKHQQDLEGSEFKMNSSVIKQSGVYQVILSSDEDEDYPPPSNVQPPLRTSISSNKSAASTSFAYPNNSSYLKSPATVATDSSKDLSMIQPKVENTNLSIKTKDKCSTPEIRIGGVNTISTPSSRPSGSDSILQSFLSAKPLVNPCVIPEVLIVSDDDDDNVPGPSSENQQSYDQMRVKEASSEIHGINPKTELDEYSFSFLDSASSIDNSGICIITGSMSLHGTDHSFHDFEEEEKESSSFQFECTEELTEDTNCSRTPVEIDVPCEIALPIQLEQSSHVVPSNDSCKVFKCSSIQVLRDKISGSDKCQEVLTCPKNPLNQDTSISSSTDMFPDNSRNEVNTQTDA